MSWTKIDTEYLLSREEAAKRYGICIRRLEQLYRRNADFPIIRFGRTVLIHRVKADEWFTERIGQALE